MDGPGDSEFSFFQNAPFMHVFHGEEFNIQTKRKQNELHEDDVVM
jgi:hypothetical protein